MFIWNDYQERYTKLYDKFGVNRLYRTKSFASEEEYLKHQEKLAAEIAKIDEEVSAEVKKIINEAWPDVEVLAFDSRMQSPARLVIR